MAPERSSMEIGSEHGGSAGRPGRPGQMTRSFPAGTMTFFLLTRGQSQVRSSPRPRSPPPPRPLYFSSFYEPYVIEAFRASPSSNKRKPTGIQSDDGAHIDEGSLLLLLSPPAVLLLERGPGFASHFFRASRSSIFEPQPRRPLPDRSDRCGNNYRRTLTRSRATRVKTMSNFVAR